MGAVCSTGRREFAARWHTDTVGSSVAEDTLAIGLFRHAGDTGEPILFAETRSRKKLAADRQ
jgi:hypothetical protein